MTARKTLFLVVAALFVLLLACLLAFSAWYLIGPKRRAGPLVTIRSPHNGDQVGVGGVVNVHSTSRDDVNKVEKVELWVDGELIEADTHPQGASLFTVVQGWQPLSPGFHTLIVRAFNGAGVPGQATIGVEAVEMPPEAVAEREPLPLPGELPAAQEVIESGEVPPGTDVEAPPGGLPSGEGPAVEEPFAEEEAPAEEEGPVVLEGPAPEAFYTPPDPDEGPPPEDIGDLVARIPREAIVHFAPRPETAPIWVEFEALEFAVDESYDDIYCYLSLADEPVERVPETEFLRPIDERRWNIAEHLGGENSRVIEVPSSGTVRVFVECYGWSGATWEYLGLTDVLHPPEDWDGHTIQVHGTGSGGFDLDYRIFPLPSIIPPPYNLVYATLGNRAYLDWRWDGNEAEIHGFRLYVNDNVVASVGPDFRSLEVSTWTTEHCGEMNEFYVTAYRGDLGEGIESSPSNLVAFAGPPCEEPDDILYVAELPTYICGGIREIDVGYQYASDHGDQVWIGAWPVGEGGTPFGGCSKNVIGHGEGVSRMYLEYPGEGRVESSHLLVEMWDLAENIFYSEIVPFPMVWNEDRPDLFISGADMDCYGLSRRVVIENGGCARVETDELYLEFTSTDGAHGEGSVPISISLGPGEKYEWRYVIGVPPRTEEEFRRECQDRWGRGFEVMVDPDNLIAEADEENNRYAVTASGDLRINSIEPVQVVYGAPLVKNKATAFRVKVNSTFDYSVQATFRLELPDAQWDTDPPATGLFDATALPPGWEYPEIWGPVTIPAGATDYEVMLPYVPDEQRDAEFHPTSNPAGIIRGREAAGVYGPDVRVVPRPVADSAEFAVQIDPDDEIAELAEGNNRMPSFDYEVITTRAWRFLFVPTKDLASGCAPELNAIEAGAQRQMEYALATFPIADSKISWGVSPPAATEPCDGQTCGYAVTWQTDKTQSGFVDSCTMMSRIASQAREDHDFGIVQTCWGGQSCGGGAVWLGAYDGGETCAHEFNHDVVPMDDIYSLDCYCGWDESYCELPGGSRFYCCYGCDNQVKADKQADGMNPGAGCTVDCGFSGTDCSAVSANCPGAANCVACCSTLCRTACGAQGGQVWECPDVRTQANMPASEGFWVNRWTANPGRFYFMDGPSGNNWMILNSSQEIGALEGRDPACGLNGADKDGYLNLIENDRFRSDIDPPALLVSGRINKKTGTAILDPFIRLSDAPLDIEPGAEGDYYFVLLDGKGLVLSKSGFTLSFYRSDPAGGPTDEAAFVYRIEWKEGTTKIELQDKNGVVLGSRDVSPNKPEVKVLYPNGGEVWATDRTYTIKWEASDADGDTLVYSIAISMDGGENWLPIATDVQANEHELSTMALGKGDKYLIRVRATDGVNTAEDVSDGTFSVGARVLPRTYIVVGALALVTVGLALGAVAIAVMARKLRQP